MTDKICCVEMEIAIKQNLVVKKGNEHTEQASKTILEHCPYCFAEFGGQQ